jgi:hypothetical protein
MTNGALGKKYANGIKLKVMRHDLLLIHEICVA